ncbi:MAG: diguanylate cyclase (GGDEF)-like protein [Candidatus Azotimanducaceae bacterium]|jgi:diguanylate cyclase (GGDEF)-like protein
MTNTSHYLMAQQDSLDANIVRQMLEVNHENEIRVNQVSTVSSALESLSHTKYDALILDLNLSSKTGLVDVARFLSDYPSLPIVILAGNDDQELAVECLRLGVQDYIYKNQLNAELLNRIMRYSIERKQIHLKLKRALAEADRKNHQLTLLARTDNLTKLPNRAYFFEVTKKAIATADRLQKSLGVLYFDLNNFKIINDRYGHAAGDHVLKEIASRLKTQLRNSDMAARIGGDEFVVLTNLLDDPVQAYSLARKVHQIICQPITLSNNEFLVGASIGIATYPEVDSVDKLVQAADMAMYEAKDNGQHFACFYTKHLENKYRNQRTLESELENAINENELHALYQPIISRKKNNSLSVEGLCRWDSHKLGSIPPDKFIPIADAAQLGDQLGSIMLEKSAQLRQFCKSNNVNLTKLAINIFGGQLADPNFADGLIKELELLNIPTDLLCIEISEQQLIDNLADCQVQLAKLRKAHISVALDDFGTGFSSITHLKGLPVDSLKLDRTLTSNIDKKPENLALCDGIIHMAHRLNMKVVAEGIERREEYESLLAVNCDEFQGYFFARPMEASALLDHWKNFDQEKI